METIAVELVVIFFLILANGFFSGSELAIIIDHEGVDGKREGGNLV